MTYIVIVSTREEVLEVLLQTIGPTLAQLVLEGALDLFFFQWLSTIDTEGLLEHVVKYLLRSFFALSLISSAVGIFDHLFDFVIVQISFLFFLQKFNNYSIECDSLNLQAPKQIKKPIYPNKNT